MAAIRIGDSLIEEHQIHLGTLTKPLDRAVVEPMS